MTGKADAVRAVSQQFKDRTNAVIEGVMAHLNDGNAKEILGPGLSPLIGRGTLKSLVTFALYADVLRMVRDMVMADGEISDEEVQESLGVLSVIAGGFAKVRSKDYSVFAQLTSRNARQFLAQYEADAGLFGHDNEATKWSGIAICGSIQEHFDDPAPITQLRDVLTGWAQLLAEEDGADSTEQDMLGSLQSLLDAHAVALEAPEGNNGGARTLTKTLAEAFLEDLTAFDVKLFTHITDEAAEVLEDYQDVWLSLDGLTTLSDAAAESLAKIEWNLSLNGVTILSDAAIKNLATHSGYLSLNGLQTLTDVAAAALATHSGYLSLNGLTTISDAAIEVLAEHSGGLSLGGLTSLSDAAVEALARNGDLVCLDGLTAISDQAIEQLAKHSGGLSLNGLPALSDAAIKALATHSGQLSLNGLSKLADGAIEALATHSGGLSLDGMTTISDTAIESLAKNQGGGLSLNGLNSLSERAIDALATHTGDLTLNGLSSLSDKAAAALAKRDGGGELELNGLVSLSDTAAEALGQFEGVLSLNGLAKLTDRTAMALAQHIDLDELLEDGRIEFTSMKALKKSFVGLSSLLASPGEDFEDTDETGDEESD